MKAERILAGLFGLVVGLVMLSKSLVLLVQALRLLAALPDNPSLELEMKGAFVGFALQLTFGLFLGWWGISKFRRQRPVTKEHDA